MPESRSERPRRASLLIAILVACVMPAVVCAQAVLFVGTGGFTGLSAAVLAAADGDIILLEDGFDSFESVTVDGKGLEIVAEGFARVRTLPLFTAPEALIVRNLSASQTLIVRGVEFTTGDVDPDTAVLVEHCAGAVVFDECTLRPSNGIGLHVVDSASVSAHASLLSGGHGQFAVTGLRVDDSNVFLHACDVLGGDGSDAFEDIFQPTTPNGDGGDGAWIFGASEVFVSGGQLRGGDGGSPLTFCFPGGDAGNGLVVGPAGSPLVRLRDVTIAPGTPTVGACGNPDGLTGVDQVIASGAVVPLAEAARDMSMSAPVVAGDDVTLTFTGEPGDAVVLLLSPGVMPGQFFAVSELVLHVALPFADVPLGVLPPSGVLELVVNVPNVPGGLDGVWIAAQAVFTAGGQKTLGGPSVGFFLAP